MISITTMGPLVVPPNFHFCRFLSNIVKPLASPTIAIDDKVGPFEPRVAIMIEKKTLKKII